MKVRAKKDFISTSFGNISAGQVLDVSERHAKLFVENKLAEHIVEGPVKNNTEEPKPPVFTQPTADQTPGSSLPAAQVSSKKTVKKLVGGGNKKKIGK